MMLKTIFKQTFSAMAIMGAAAFVPVMAQSGIKYITLETAQPSDTPDKVEVLEFFAYSCSHCAEMEPLFQEWEKKLPENVAFIPVPVAFNAAMQPMQHLYYSLVALDKTDLHPKVFTAIHKEGKKLFNRDAIIQWATEQGIDKEEFIAAYDSFGVNTKVKRAVELGDTYQVQATPSIAIAGKYLTSPGMTGTYASSIMEAQALLDQVLAENK